MCALDSGLHGLESRRDALCCPFKQWFDVRSSIETNIFPKRDFPASSCVQALARVGTLASHPPRFNADFLTGSMQDRPRQGTFG